MDKEKFRAKFEPRMRVWFDWAAFASGDWQVRVIERHVPHGLHRLWTPWYPGATRGPPHADPDAWPLLVLEAAAKPHLLGPNEPGLAEHLGKWRDRRKLKLPAYALPRGGLLLLDGNHRVVVAAMLRRPALLKLAVVHGPGDAHLLPDLPWFH
jgi:hypothetical protein